VNPAILVAVDGSPSSNAAVDWAARDAALHNLPLVLVHVLAPPVVMTFPETPMPPGYTEWQQEQGERHLREAVKIAERQDADLRVDAQIVVGSTVPMLVDMSRDAARLVVGSRGHGLLRRSLLGSVSSSLVRHAHCPVAVIHEGHPEGPPRPDTAPVVVGIDGSPVSEAATALAFEEASLRGVELVAVYAWHDTGMLLGSVSQAVVQSAHSPVLVVRPTS
jgi:nucleotide-binding universal stress UspA family protein